VSYYANHHKQTLIATVLIGVGLAIYLTVLVQLASYLRAGGQWTLAGIVLVGGAASAGLFAAGDAIYGAISQVVAQPGADPRLAKALYELDQFAGIPMYWLILPVIVSVTVAGARGLFPGWSVWTSGLFAVLVALGGLCVKADGAFAAGTGPIANLAFGAALVFLLEVGLLLWGASEREPVPAQMTV
jgi:hypothetical protein